MSAYFHVCASDNKILITRDGNRPASERIQHKRASFIARVRTKKNSN